MTRKGNDDGFTLVELLVVMIIIGILSAIAIPVFVAQREKAKDTTTKSDIGTAGKELTTFYVDGDPTTVVTATIAGNILTLSATGYTNTIRTSAGTGYVGSATNAITYQTGTGCTKAIGWVLSLGNSGGSLKNFYFSAQRGLTSTAPVLSSACG